MTYLLSDMLLFNIAIFFYFSRIFFISFLSLPLLHWPLWSSSYGSWIYNYLCDQCLSYLKLWVRIPLKAKCTRYSFMWSSFSVTCCRSLIFSGFLHQKPWPPWYNWKIVESGGKHHDHPYPHFITFIWIYIWTFFEY
jgi:hypothetical protein